MENNEIKVSLGIPVYNESLFLKDTIESLLNQSYTNLDLRFSIFVNLNLQWTSYPNCWGEV